MGCQQEQHQGKKIERVLKENLKNHIYYKLCKLFEIVANYMV